MAKLAFALEQNLALKHSYAKQFPYIAREKISAENSIVKYLDKIHATNYQ